YTITVTNNGPSDTLTAHVTDTLRAPPGSPSICQETGTVTCANTVDYSAYTSGSSISLGTLTPSQTKTLKLRATAAANLAAGATVTNTASASSPTDTGSPRTAADTNTVSSFSTLARTKTESQLFTYAAFLRSYTITVTNNGPS